MSKVSSLESHIPKQLMASLQKSNDMVQARQTTLVQPTGGTTVTNGSTANFKVQQGSPAALNGFGLTGKIRAVGAYDTADLRFQDGVRSCISSMNILLGNKQLTNINSDAQLIPFIFQNSNYSYEEYSNVQEEVLAKDVDVPLAAATPKQFYLSLREYGLDVNKLLQTGNGRDLSIRIGFENDMTKVYYGAADGTNTATGFEITDLALSVESYTLSPAAQKALMDGLMHQSVDYYMYAYNINNVTLTASTALKLQFNTAYRDLAAVYFIPKLAVAVNGSAIPTLNPLAAGLRWNTGGSVPERLLCNLSGLAPANINGADGQSGKIDRNRSLQLVSKVSPEDRLSGYGWAQYVNNDSSTGVLAVNFSKTDTKSPMIKGGGANAYAASSLLKLDLNLAAAATAGATLFGVNQFVRRMRVSANSVDIEE